MKFKDLIDTRFGKLLVVERVDVEKNASWKCLCDCGNTRVARSQYLTGKRGYNCCGCEKHKKSAYNQVIKSYKIAARNRGLSWDLSNEELFLLIQRNCFYCDIKPKNKTYRHLLKYNGVDRLDNTKGYFVNNCVPCCEWCNKGKMDKTVSEFINWINSVHKNIESNSIQSNIVDPNTF
jgi:hypothetical protein